MSDEHSERTSAESGQSPTYVDKWGDDIPPERKAELDELAAQQRAWAEQPAATRGDSHFKSVQLTGADVFYLAARALAGPDAGADALADTEARLPSLVGSLYAISLSALHLEGADLFGAHLEGAFLRAAHLEDAVLLAAHLQGADLRHAHLDRTNLYAVHLERAQLDGAQLAGADLREAFLDTATDLRDATLIAPGKGSVRVSDTRWGGVNLATVAGTLAPPLGDEQAARDWRSTPLAAETAEQRKQPRQERARARAKHAALQAQEGLRLYQAAVRANRQLATALRSQGLNETADRFAYRAQFLQREVLRREGQLLRWIGSVLLDAVAGYGYRPVRSLFTYVAVVLAFAAVYFALGGVHGRPLSWNESLVVSLTAFHGRGFFATAFQPGDPQAAVAAIEAVFGLLIEIIFIATFTQRFFAR